MKKFQKILLTLAISLPLIIFAANELLNTQLPSLSALTNLSEVDISNAETILGDQYSDSMEITAGDINAKFKAAQILIDDAKNNSGGAFDYDACSSYSVNNDLNGNPLEDSFETYVNNGLPQDIQDVFQLSECAQRGCLVDSLRESCVADTRDCKGSYSETAFVVDDTNGGRGLCSTIINDLSGNSSYFAPTCSNINNSVACKAIENGLAMFITDESTGSQEQCALGGDNTCYNIDSSGFDIESYCMSFSEFGDIADQDSCESSGACTFIENDGCYDSNNI